MVGKGLMELQHCECSRLGELFVKDNNPFVSDLSCVLWKFIFLLIPTGAQQAFLCGSQCSFIDGTHVSPVKAWACIILQLCLCRDVQLGLLPPTAAEEQKAGKAEAQEEAEEGWAGRAHRFSCWCMDRS